MILNCKTCICIFVGWASLWTARAATSSVGLDAIGDRALRILSPTLLELSYVTTKDPDPAPPSEWNFVGENFALSLPPAGAFSLTVDGQPAPVSGVGFKRRPLYAPLRRRDLRIGNFLYLTLSQPVASGQNVLVQNPDATLWPSNDFSYSATMDPGRFNPALHVNQVGYSPSDTKKGAVGNYLGSLGEMPIPATTFSIVSTASGAVVFNGNLVSHPDVGYTYSPSPYQQVLEADFSALQVPGEYVLQVPGLGVSYPFLIHPGAAAAFARTYALGLYHQRCGTDNVLPFTRHQHGICHSAPAEVPDMTFTSVNYQLSSMSWDYANNPNHTAPQLKDVDSSLYPFINRGPIDVSHGHHDAGDYSKYTINSAGLIHHLVFAADSLGAGDLDNLGLPESGDGKSDLLQEAKWEADFLSKMQDADGGFYFLVYPRDRAYEDDVLPDHGDPQVVFPKTTAATAAAVGALADIASSPRFKQQFPTEAALYLAKAKLGWDFLMRAIATYGKNGSYQKITHYGNEFMHDDELAWAAASLFAATGEAGYHAKLMEFFPDPNAKSTRRWDWWRMFEGYGCAVRSYAFAARSGRLSASQLDPDYLARCEAEVLASGDDIARFARQTAYGTSFPDPSKAFRSAGWYFSLERAFELATAFQLRPVQDYLDAILSNRDYEAGCNPVNITYITGLGWKRWREIVHQYALNDTRVLPPSGLPLGNIQGGFAYLENYKQELGQLCFPPDGAGSAPYPFYDRFGDSFNTTTEFVVVDQARGLATLAFLLARSGDATSLSQSRLGSVQGLPASIPAGEDVSVSLDSPLDLAQARIVWEAKDQEPFIGPVFTFAPKESGEQWVEVEAQLPDGRRIFATNHFTATFPLNLPPNPYQSAPVSVRSDVVALYHADSALTDAAGQNLPLTLSGNARFDAGNLGWMQTRSGAALRFDDLGDRATVAIPTGLLYSEGVTSLTLEAMIYVQSYKGWNRGRANILTLVKGWNASLEFYEDIYAGALLRGGSQFGTDSSVLAAHLPVQEWHHLSLTIDTAGYSARVDGHLIASVPSTELANWNKGTALLEIGNFEGWMDEIVVRSQNSTSPIDSDADGLPDDFESSNGLNPFAADDASSDFDGDGLTALQEFQLQTDPNNSQSRLGLLSSDYSAGSGLRLQALGTPAGPALIEFSDSLPANAWTPLATLPAGANLSTYIDFCALGVQQRFYRLRSTATSASSGYSGFIRRSLQGRSDNLLSLPFTRPPAAEGTVRSVAGSSVQIQGSPEWAPNQWVYSSGTQTNTYFLFVRNGSRAGEFFTILSNQSSGVSLDLQGRTLEGLGAGDRVAIIPYWTLGTVFPGGNGVHASLTAGTRATEIFFPDMSGAGVNRGPAAIYYFRDGAWRQVGAGLAVKNDDVILPDMFITVRHNLPVTTEFVACGTVLEGPWRTHFRRLSTSAQDNIFAIPRPTAISLNASGLIASGAFRPSLTAGTRADELYVYDNESVVLNKSPSAIYYYRNGAWRKVGAGNLDVGEDQVFQPGTGFVIRSAAGPASDDWANSVAY